MRLYAFFVLLLTINVFSLDISLNESDVTSKLSSRFLIENPDSNIPGPQPDNNFNYDDHHGGSNNPLENKIYIPVMTLSYAGSWEPFNIKNSIKQFDFFNGNSGLVEFRAYENSHGLADEILLEFYDGEYKDKKSTSINFKYDNSTDFDPINSTFKNNSFTFQLAFYDGPLSFHEKKKCHGSYKISFYDLSTKQPYQKVSNNYKDIQIELWLESPECQISVSAILLNESVTSGSQPLYYASIMTFICILHIYACIRTVKKVIAEEIEGVRTSIMTLGYFIGWDIFLCAFHFYEALISNEFFQFFITPAFAYFILVAVFETRLILLVWKATYYHQYHTINQVRRGITRFYKRFYGFLALFLLGCYFFLPATWFLYLTCPAFIPQIIHNAIYSQRYKFDYNFVFYLGVARALPPIYLKAFPFNIFKVTPVTSFGYIYAGIVVAQIIILGMQSIYGSRFFVPSCFLPPKFNYYVKVNTNQSADEVDNCPICMDALNREPSNAKSSFIQKPVPAYILNMLTPCKHQFHDKCLREWMDRKLECPFCRTKLPPLD